MNILNKHKLLLSVFGLSMLFATKANALDSLKVQSTAKVKDVKTSMALKKVNEDIPKGDKLPDTKPVADESGPFQNFVNTITAGGYYRAYGLSRSMSNPYGDLGENKYLGLVDGYYDPNMLMYVGGNPSASTSFGAELILSNPFTAYQGPGNGVVNQPNVYQSLVLRGSADTKYGNFFLVAGGIEWRALTKFTIGSNTLYNRFSLFERQPWDGAGNLNARYASYYYTGTYNIDARFGTQGLKGWMLQANGLPLGLTADIFYGKTQYNGGFDRSSQVNPSRTFAAKVNRKFKGVGDISLVAFHSFNTVDSVDVTELDIPKAQVDMYTVDFSLKNKLGIALAGEMGMGRYLSPNYTDRKAWGEAVLAELTLPKKLVKFGKVYSRFYRMSKNFVNNTAGFSNVTVAEAYTGYRQGQNIIVLQPTSAGMMGVGDIANNRQSFNLNTEFKVAKKLKITVGTEMASEIEDLANDTVLAFGHKINALAYSRLPIVFPLGGPMGPNARMNQVYRGVYETTSITDQDGSGNSIGKRHFAALDVQLKLRQKVFGRDLYAFYLTGLSSINNKFSPIVQSSKDAFISSHTQELELYYEITPNFMLDIYAGIENIKGSNRITMGDLGGVLDQQGRAFGLGCDIRISTQTSLFVRNRWFDYSDKSQTDENMAGRETTLELKIFF